MATDWLPKSAANLQSWGQNLETNLPAAAGQLNMGTSETQELLGIGAAIKTRAQAVLDAQAALDTAFGALRDYVADNGDDLRRRIGAIKTMSPYNPGIGATLQITGGGDTPLDPATYQPEIAAMAFPGYVRITGTKRGVDALNLYCRLKGQSTWTLIATKRARFPFDDDAPLAQASTPETREYRAIAVVDDEEFGQPSDIVSVTYGG